jgi:endonuclease G
MPNMSEKLPINENKPNIKLLSIGINKYISEGISDLYQCVQDVERMQAFLKQLLQLSDRDLCLLTDEGATRENIISAFREHFQGLQAGDVALLHYSGHGSWEDTNPAFIEAGIDAPGSRTEVLVCHDSTVNNTYNIADKELRWLIHELQYNGQGEATGVKFIALMDCCYAGSMFRRVEEGVRRRMHPGRKAFRPLSELLGPYASMESLRLPVVNYISMSACSPRQSAIEDPGGGVFTNAVLRVLERSAAIGRLPNYAELFSSVNEITRINACNIQHPHFEYAGHVNPYEPFLGLEGAKPQQFPVMTIHGAGGQISLGAIHGVKPGSIQDWRIPIYDGSDFEHPVGSAEVQQVELEHTIVKNIELNGRVLRGKNISLLERTYHAGLKGHALPLQLSIAEEAQHLRAAIFEVLAKPQYEGRFFIDEQANYMLSVDAEQLLIRRKKGAEWPLLHGVKSTDTKAIDYIFGQLLQVARWEQVNNVTSAKSTSIDVDGLDFSFSYYDYQDQLQTVSLNAGPGDKRSMQIELDYIESMGGIPYIFKVKNNTSEDLFFYLVYLSRKLQVAQKYENYLKPLAATHSAVLYDSALKNVGLGISSDSEEEEATDIFLLIASRKELNIPYVFEQGGLEGAYGKVIDSPEEWEAKYRRHTRGEVQLRARNRVHWAVKRIEVTVKKKVSTKGYNSNFLGPGHPVELPALPDDVAEALVRRDDGRIHVLDYYNYSVLMHRVRRLPLLTAANIDGRQFLKINRKEVGGHWKYDDRISRAFQLGKNLYEADKSDFDRGHMTKREDVQWGATREAAKKAAKATFYYTNSVPQHARLNQVAWRKIEDYILHRQAVAFNKMICLFTGPLLEKNDPIFVTPVDGGWVQIPCWFWKVVYFTKEDGQLYRVCFLYSQGNVLRDSGIVKVTKGDPAPADEYFMGFDDAKTYQVTTSVIEQLTGFSFPDAVDTYTDDTRPLEMIVKEVEVKGEDGEGEVVYLFRDMVL